MLRSHRRDYLSSVAFYNWNIDFTVQVNSSPDTESQKLSHLCIGWFLIAAMEHHNYGDL